MKVSRRNIDRNLPKKGFVKKNSNHHIYFHHNFNGIDTGVYTYISHSKRISEYSGRLLTDVRKQLKLDSNQEVVDLVNCPMSEDEYNQVLRQKGLILDE